MSQGKIELSVGPVSFSAEGEQTWLAEQLDKVLKSAPELARIHPPATSRDAASTTSATDKGFKETLAAYIKAKGGEDNQVKRFLATADWLRLRGEQNLTTSAVTKALKENHQKRLANAADCLNQNVSKGYCEKVDGGFYITPDGLKSLGHPA